MADRIRYLDEVMAEIDAEVRRRRASGDLPAGLERELDELFLEFSPVGLQGRARLRETLSLVDGSAYVDIAVPTASNKAVGSYIKRAMRKGLGWYMNFIVTQIVKFAWSVSRMFHVVVDHIEDLEAAVEAHRSPDLPVRCGAHGQRRRHLVGARRPSEALAGVTRAGRWWPTAATPRWSSRCWPPGSTPTGSTRRTWPSSRRSTGVSTCGPRRSLDHLDVVAAEALGGIVLTGSVQWLRPNERERLLDLVSSRLAVDGTLVLHSASPGAWAASAPAVVRDLAPGRPLHPETWAHLLATRGFAVRGHGDRR